MALKERFIEVLNAVLPESWQIGFQEAYGVGADADEANWRPLTGDALRDLPLLTQERMLRISHWLWEQNPLANSIIEMPVAYLLAEGVKLVVQDESNQKVLDRFWKDPINNMAIKLPKKVRELAMFGEQLYPAFVNEIDGMVRIGYIDPKIIGEVVKDPDNSEQAIGIVTKRDSKGRYFKFRIIINGPEEVFTQRTQAIRQSFTDGEVFYYCINDLSAGSRGRSDLLHLADWLDAYDQFLFGEVDRYKLLRSLVWDLELQNANEDTVKKRSREFQLPASGGAYVHNASEKLEPKTPKLESQDTSEGARLLRNQILAGARLPEHWFGGGGNVNRATASEMGEPTFKNLKMRQNVWKNILESIGRYVLMKSAATDGNNKVDWSDPKWDVQAIFPELVSGDIQKNAQALQFVVASCAVAVQSGLLSEKTAVHLIAAAAGELGVEIDAAKELETAQAEALTRKEADSFNTPPGVGASGDGTGTGDAAAGSAAMKEALELIQDCKTQMEDQVTRLAQAAERRGEDPAAFAVALRESMAASASNVDKLVTALATRQGLDITFKHGESTKTIHDNEGRALFTLTQKDA